MGDARGAINIAELRRMARARLPRVVFDYLDGGAEAEQTLRDNVRAFRRWQFRPCHGGSIPAFDLSTQVMGQTLAWPAMAAPIGYSGLMHRDGERGMARAAAKAGIPYVMSTISGTAMEDVAATGVSLFQQIYLLGGREAGEATLERARAAGVKGLFLTVDTAVAGLRERDLRNGLVQLMGRDIAAKLPYLPDVLAHPRWVFDYLMGARMTHLPNVVVPGKGPLPLTDVASALARSVVTWEDLAWIRAQWKGPLAVKGVLTAEDARRAVDGGADAVVVSNHGGRQLDGVAASLDALPEIAKAVGETCDVLMDGGIRRGGDIAKALALGARAVLVGRAAAYGLAAGGAAGAGRALTILNADLLRTLVLLGKPSVAALDGQCLQERR
jgi:L-lactate dehydrogenase (cytochrome)